MWSSRSLNQNPLKVFPFNRLYLMFCWAGNAWEESASTIQQSLSGRTWLPLRRPALCSVSPSTKIRFTCWRGSQIPASPALRRSMTSPPTSETTAFYMTHFISWLWGASVHIGEMTQSVNSRSLGHKIPLVVLLWVSFSYIAVYLTTSLSCCVPGGLSLQSSLSSAARLI